MDLEPPRAEPIYLNLAGSQKSLRKGFDSELLLCTLPSNREFEGKGTHDCPSPEEEMAVYSKMFRVNV